MTERKPPDVAFESWVEQQIREATARGEFDNLPGAGKPLPGYGGADDENWWLKNYLRKEGVSTDALLPTPLQLRKEIEQLPETVRELVAEEQVRNVVAKLNRRIMDWLRSPSGPPVQVRLVNTQSVVERWRADRARPAGAAPAAPVPAGAEPAATAVPVGKAMPERRRTPWWRRFARRSARP